MQTVHITFDEDLLATADRVAREQEMNRSALVRQALRAYLRQLHLQKLEQQDREGYERHPDSLDDLDTWEQVATCNG
jgi:metal-responsive CopG/Arc/MetJ family transcriptional regulator